MKHRAGWLLMAFVLGWGGVGPCLGMQQPVGEPIRLTVGSTDGPPQSEVTVEVALSAPIGAPIRSLSLTVAFPRELLHFSHAGLSGPLEGRAGLSAEVEEEGNNASRSVLRLDLSSVPEGSGLELAAGPLAEVTFVIYEVAEPATDILLESEVSEVVMVEAGGSPVPVVAENGTISVVESLIFSCFFYMH